ncbi:MAG: response regulator [Thermodesulfobacteriota bacterium]
MTLKVLAVDDSKTIRKIVAKAFAPYDCQVIEAENGIEGLAIAGKDKPDLIILDITMPVMNGTEMLQKLKAQSNLKDIPVIMLTAESGKENVINILKMGVKDYIVKPFKGEQLIDRVSKLFTLKPVQVQESEKPSCVSHQGDITIFTLPERIERQQGPEFDTMFQQTLKGMADAGQNKIVLDLHKIKEVNMFIVRLIIGIVQHGQRARVKMHAVGSGGLAAELKGFQETSELVFHETLDAALAAF